MEHDRLYYWDYIGSKGTRTLLGEIQTNFNMGVSIDGSKDTCKVECFSNTLSSPIKPYTVCYHENTNTWWIVSKDKVERYPDDINYLYKHTIQLEGAIELLNARDLTDCGFYQNMYTIDSFAKRLVELSTFELKGTHISFDYGASLDGNMNIDYIKAFENYTLLSALREFFDGYNMSVKLSFTANNNNKIVNAVFKVVPKTGMFSVTPKNLDDYMNDVKGIGTMSKGSYGNTVISNAENVVSTKSKVYPTVGYARLGSTDFYLDSAKNNIVFRLPSKVNSVEWVQIITGNFKVGIGMNIDAGQSYSDPVLMETFIDPSDQKTYDRAIDWIRYSLTHDFGSDVANYVNSNYGDSFWNDAKGENAFDTFLQNASYMLYDIAKYDPVANEYHSDHTINEFYNQYDFQHGTKKPWVLASKVVRDGVQEPYTAMYWERGSNEIKGFDIFDKHGTSNLIYSKDKTGIVFMQFSVGSKRVRVIFGNYRTYQNVDGGISASPMVLSPLNVLMRCKYMPMSNLKIKYDNTAFGNDSKLYNQNGKYTDGVALSRSLLSYKNEIESDTITRYAIGYVLSSMPQVGEIYYKNNIPYVIGNASFDFNQHEGCYFITAEYTLSKKIAIKTALTNPNTNIRDYGIPQSYNVARKQLYRDFYEITYSPDSDNIDINWKLPLNKVITLDMLPKEYSGHTALVRVEYDHAIGGGGTYKDGSPVQPSDKWYFQVDSTCYVLKKQLVEVFDFQDNNIIGYDSQNITCGFDITRLFEVIPVGSSDIDAVNTPISYVDEKGKFKGIFLSVVNADNLKKSWDEYVEDEKSSYTGTMSDKTGSYYNRCVFIPKPVFDNSQILSYADYYIYEENYNKDPIEVPVFEYCCQVDDSDNVIIGDNVFDNKEDDLMYFYEEFIVGSGQLDNNNFSLQFVPSPINDLGNGTLKLDDSDTGDMGRKVVRLFSNTSNMISLSLYYDVSCDGRTPHFQSMLGIAGYLNNFASNNIDMVVVRYAVKKNYHSIDGVVNSGVSCDLMFILRNVKQATVLDIPPHINNIVLYANHYSVN